jgi:hypothetical protein
MPSISRFEDETRPAIQIRWLQADRQTPWDFTSGWDFKVDWVRDDGTLAKTKPSSGGGFTGGNGGGKRSVHLANLVVSLTTDDLLGLGGPGDGIEYELRVGAKTEGQEWMFLGTPENAPRMVVKSRPV